MVKGNNKFRAPPLSKEEKEKLAEKFIQASEEAVSMDLDNISFKLKQKKEIKTIYIRAPESYWEDIQEIMAMTGLSMNAVCLELLRPVIKRKLKELREEG